MTDMTADEVLGAGSAPQARASRLREGADRLAGSRRRISVAGRERLLLAVAGTLMLAGLLSIGLGWYGASHATLLQEQVAYLISGGLGGIALATIGSLGYFTYWLTVSVREAREHEAARRQDHRELLAASHQDHRELLAALQAAAGIGSREEDDHGSAGGPRAQRPLRGSPRRT